MGYVYIINSERISKELRWRKSCICDFESVDVAKSGQEEQTPYLDPEQSSNFCRDEKLAVQPGLLKRKMYIHFADIHPALTTS